MTRMLKPELNAVTLTELSEQCSQRLAHVFSTYLQAIPALDLKAAMEYTLFNGGKHLRPLLIYATGHIFAAPLANLDIPASAIECLHTYSLIHDDLPAMDNADLRRGKASCHKVFGDAMAILTGDALHTLAMQILSEHPAPLIAINRIEMIRIISTACGPYGMAAGQALDITLLSDPNISTDLLLEIYRLKTGALFSACIELGRLAANDNNEKNKDSLKTFADCIGLAFQIQDDILDIEAPSETLGKTQGIDQTNQKITYPQLMGIAAAKEKVQSLFESAFMAIEHFGENAKLLRDLTLYMLKRNY